MKQVLFLLMTLSLGLLTKQASYAQETAAAIAGRLVEDGFENVRAARNGNYTNVVLEDNHYRGIFRGLARALQLISPSDESQDTICVVVLDNRIPRLTINATHVSGTWMVDAHYGGHVDRNMARRKAQNSSALKVDLIPYPSLIFSNHRYDRLWSSALYISPTLEMGLWPGARLVAQVKLLAYNNFVDEHFQSVLPGYVVLSQFLKPTDRLDLSLSGGLFNINRTGIDLRADYHLTKRLDLGVILGCTGPWYLEENSSLRLCQWDKLNAVARLNYYEPHSNLQIDLKAGQFVFEDRGVRLDVNRHFRDYAIGVFGNVTTYNTNIGIEFSIPVSPKKMGRHRAVRVRMPETLSFSFNENIDVYQAYNPDRMEQLYKTAPDQNYSANYWQPEMIRDCILLYLEGVFD